MELFQQSIQSLVGALAAQAGLSLYKLLIDWFTGGDSPDDNKKTIEILEQLGATSSHRIRELVARELQGKAVPRERADELTRVLLQLARKHRLVTSQAATRSAGQGDRELIDQILGYLKPVRRAGEDVSPSEREWRLDEFLGMGSFGEVWLGTHKHEPALKYAFKFFVHEGAKAWLHREQRKLVAAQQALKGEPNLVRLVNLAVDRERYPYLVLEYLRGGTLEDWIFESPEHRTPIRKDEVIRGMVRVMARAHERGITHRDLKPANVLLTAGPDAQAKISDFGLADVREVHPREGTGLRGSVYGSRAAAMVGTPMYWPPEAWIPTARRGGEQDDVFAIGVIWYQVLVERVERPPYDFAEALRAAGQDTQTIWLISRCLAGPERRFLNAGELDAELQGTTPPEWPPVPARCVDVSLLVKEYLAATAD